MKKKKIIGLFLLIVLLSFILSACVSSNVQAVFQFKIGTEYKSERISIENFKNPTLSDIILSEEYEDLFNVSLSGANNTLLTSIYGINADSSQNEYIGIYSSLKEYGSDKKTIILGESTLYFSNNIEELPIKKDAIYLFVLEKNVDDSELLAAKIEAEKEIRSYVNIEDYREPQKLKYNEIIRDSGADIANAMDIESVKNALDLAKYKIDALKTDAELVEEEKNYPILKDNIKVTDEKFGFKLSEIDKNSKVSVWNNGIDNNILSYFMELKPGENVIQLTNNLKESKYYTVFYDNGSGITAETTLNAGVFNGNRFGFSVFAKDKNNKQIAPQFKQLANQPNGDKAHINGNISVKLFIDGEYLAENGNVKENCDLYFDNSQVKEIAYVSWADTVTGNIYYKVNLPDVLKEFKGFFEIETSDAFGMKYYIYREIEYKYNLDSPSGHVTFSLDAFTLGSGYIIEPITVPFYANENNAQFLARMLSENGFGYDNNGSLTNSFYLEAIYDGHDKSAKNPYIGDLPGKLNIYASMPNFPKSIIDLLIENGINIEDLRDSTSYGTKRKGEDGIMYLSGLGEFDYYYTSGWMYSVNGKFPGEGSAATYPKDGDVIRWQFTLFGLGADLGGTVTPDGGEEGFFPQTNKTELSKLLGKIKTEENKDKYKELYLEAINTMQDFLAEQTEIDALIKKIEDTMQL